MDKKIDPLEAARMQDFEENRRAEAQQAAFNDLGVRYGKSSTTVDGDG